jgi:hypothetical protein
MKFGRLCLWLMFFTLLLLAADQAMVHLSAGESSAGEFRQRYLAARQKLLQANAGGGEDAGRPLAPPRYVYVDADGNLNFAESLQEVPPSLRAEAQRLRD